jgi:FMN-dependent NADH-azoreductase
MAARFVSQWQNDNPGGRIVIRDLVASALPHVTAPWLAAYFTPPDALTREMKAQLALSDALVQELLDADELVISTPVYNYNIPALKAWIDHIVRKGLMARL